MRTTFLDRTVACIALLLLLPLLVVLAGLVRATSPGPALFKQVRVGRAGRHFVIYKFRSMHTAPGTGSGRVSATGDPRVTPVGRVLRKWYLDELPQLFNIVKGDMRLVGPRPETPEFVALYTPAERRVLSVHPGLVGPSTLAFMDEAERLAGCEDPEHHYRTVLLHERVRLDLAYVERRSLTVDLRLLTRQLLAIVRP